jgi:glycosyltransferase involved in cell wall biosynthesis
MKILVVTQYFWPENFRINEIVEELQGRGHQVSVLTGIPNYPDGVVFPDFRKSPESFSRYSGAEIFRVPMFPRGNGKVSLILNYLSFAVNGCLAGAWKLRGRKFDVILAFEPSPITVGIPSAFMRWIKKAPQAFWVLDLWPETLKAINVLHASFSLNLVDKLVRFVYKRCDLILAQSNSFISYIREQVDAGKRIEYFPAWPEAVNWDLSETSPAPELEHRPDLFTVLFAGNIGEAQDFPAILDAAERIREHKNIRLVIVGDGRDAQRVADRVTQSALEDSFLMLGRFGLERMPEFFVHADALLVSLKDEPIFSMTIPGKLQSYLATGIPVLAMLNGEGADVVANAGAGLVCKAGDSEQLADNIIHLAQMDDDQRQQMGKNGKAFCNREFDKRLLLNQLETWLSRLSDSTLTEIERSN